jgi:hypothetical protein
MVVSTLVDLYSILSSRTRIRSERDEVFTERLELCVCHFTVHCLSMSSTAAFGHIGGVASVISPSLCIRGIADQDL